MVFFKKRMYKLKKVALPFLFASIQLKAIIPLFFDNIHVIFQK